MAVILVSALLALPPVGFANIYSYSALLFVVAALQVEMLVNMHAGSRLLTCMLVNTQHACV